MKKLFVILLSIMIFSCVPDPLEDVEKEQINILAVNQPSTPQTQPKQPEEKRSDYTFITLSFEDGCNGAYTDISVDKLNSTTNRWSYDNHANYCSIFHQEIKKNMTYTEAFSYLREYTIAMQEKYKEFNTTKPTFMLYRYTSSFLIIKDTKTRYIQILHLSAVNQPSTPSTPTPPTEPTIPVDNIKTFSWNPWTQEQKFGVWLQAGGYVATISDRTFQFFKIDNSVEWKQLTINNWKSIKNLDELKYAMSNSPNVNLIGRNCTELNGSTNTKIVDLNYTPAWVTNGNFADFAKLTTFATKFEGKYYLIHLTTAKLVGSQSHSNNWAWVKIQVSCEYKDFN